MIDRFPGGGGGAGDGNEWSELGDERPHSIGANVAGSTGFLSHLGIAFLDLVNLIFGELAAGEIGNETDDKFELVHERLSQ